jgi:hypothetical protein
MGKHEEAWPPLPVAEWQDTRDTLHMYTQIVGKIRLVLSPRVNHWWEVPLYVTARGLTTSPIPYDAGVFEIQFDFIEHRLIVQTSAGAVKTIALAPVPVAEFYEELMSTLRNLGIAVKMWTLPCEVPNPIHFEQDRVHSAYDPEYAHRFWRALVSTDTVFKEFRARFLGKSSPVHFFWGSFDMAVTRFSGRRAPERPGADSITREAYSHEVISGGFWPGTGEIDATYYAYAAPEPPGFSKAAILPDGAFYNTQLSEFFLPYEAVRKAASPRDALLAFLESTYEAGASLGNWDRKEIERTPPASRPPVSSENRKAMPSSE